MQADITTKKHLKSDLFGAGQIRLAQLSLYNWGSFHGLHTADIDAEGTLITGDNGSGKSTLVDGLMALLLPAGRATFNVAAAQGDRSDRSLLSYMRGSFGSMHDGASTRVKSKREGAVVTGLRALYQADDGSYITLAALFWTTQASNSLSDVKRVYVVAKRNLALKELLDAYGEGNARSLNQWLKQDPLITACGDSFSSYQELYRKLLYMHNKNAPALLSRALGLKKIDDLTALIRELVLEPSNVREDAKKVVDEFSDLVAIHEKLLDARAQKNHLTRLPELDKKVKALNLKLLSLMREKEGLPIYFAQIEQAFWQEKIQQYEEKLEAVTLSIKQSSDKVDDAEQRVERCHSDYIHAGGDRIESLKKELVAGKKDLERSIQRSAHYQQVARQLKLNEALSEEEFINNQSLVVKKQDAIKQDNEASQDKFGAIAAKISGLTKTKADLTQEISTIESRPDSNVDARYQQLRDELVSALSLKREQCLFIAELMDVKAEEKQWQGAIERALGGLRTTLLVPYDCFSMVTAWLNARHTGLYVRVQVVADIQPKQTAIFKTDGYLRKLIWREHAYREWLKHHLAHFDLHCVESTKMLDNTPFSMTLQGLIHKEKGRFEKKDQYKIDNRRDWCLGFSNTSRLSLLKQDYKDADNEFKQESQHLAQARKALDDINGLLNLWDKMGEFQWDDIKAPYWQQIVKQLSDDLAALEQKDSELDVAQKQWEVAKLDLKTLRDSKEGYLKQQGELSKSLEDAQLRLTKAAEVAVLGLADEIKNALKQRVKVISVDDIDDLRKLLSIHDKEIEQASEYTRNQKDLAVRQSIGIMSSYRAHESWRVIAADWGADMSSLDDYLAHLNQLETEGLPQLVEQFIERLNKHATQSLVRIVQRLESEREDIEERIDTINNVLKRTEFRAGSHLKIGRKIEKYTHVIEFNQYVKTVLSQATSKDHEARFSQLTKVINILEKASNPSTANTLESQRLLDPRHQMSFFAEEIETATDKVLDVLESSSGKSGGEKESFAGTIVAASLAYVLSPEGYEKPVYCTVFLDEAFSNTAEAVSRRVLRVFKELHIHVNLITPYKNLNLARESARSLLIAERNQETHESHLCEVTWEEVDRQLAQQQAQKIANEAKSLGIELES